MRSVCPSPSRRRRKRPVPWKASSRGFESLRIAAAALLIGLAVLVLFVISSAVQSAFMTRPAGRRAPVRRPGRSSRVRDAGVHRPQPENANENILVRGRVDQAWRGEKFDNLVSRERAIALLVNAEVRSAVRPGRHRRFRQVKGSDPDAPGPVAKQANVHFPAVVRWREEPSGPRPASRQAKSRRTPPAAIRNCDDG